MTTKVSMNAPAHTDLDLATAKQQLLHLQELHASGTLSLESYEQGKSLLERRILDIVLKVGSAEGIEAKLTNPAVSKPSNRLLMGLVGAILLIAASGYGWMRYSSSADQTTAATDIPFGQSTANNGSVGGTPHATNFDQIAAMTEKLSEKLKDKPQDAEGWAMLARSYSVLGRNPEALAAYEKAVSIRGDDAALLADYADSLAIKNDRKLEGEPMKIVERALKVDPRNLKALSLAGTHSFEKKDFINAVRFWEQVIAFGPAEDSIVEQVRSSLAEARQLGGLPVPAGKPEVTLKPSPETKTKTVSGTVSILPSLIRDIKPEDTVFIFARPTQGSRMPLAILQKQVKDLPITFTLDDSMAMSPAAKLSQSERVTVGARVSRSGNAMPQKGDYVGQSGDVAIGATGLVIEIKDAVRQ